MTSFSYSTFLPYTTLPALLTEVDAWNLILEDDGAAELEVEELDELFIHSSVSNDRNVDCE